MATVLRWLDRTTLPVEADALTPRGLAGLAPAEVARLSLPVGNRDAEVGDLFAVELDGEADDLVRFEGDLGRVRGLGRRMDGGRLEVRGRAGAFLGRAMTGGTITVHGDVGDFAGAEMAGGTIRVHGSAGRHLGAALPGSRLGMREGVILVDGDAGEGLGDRMRRGLVAVGGAAGDDLGCGMVAGSLLVFGPARGTVGLGMKRGTIGLFSDDPPALLPSFVASGRYRFPFLALYLRQLAAWGFGVPARVTSAEMGRYNGDRAGGGQGEVLVLAGGRG